MSQDARQDEEQSTLRRAQVLGLDYYDTNIQDKNLIKNVLTNDEMYQFKIVPLVADQSNVLFGITTVTSQNSLKYIREHFLDQRVNFALISDSGFRDYMKLFDPPKQIVYQDINISENQTDTVSQISDILNQVNADDMLAYLVSQAHKLNSSDIHIETQRNDVRIRFRIDGVLHIVAKLSFEKYRILVSAVASASNISTSSTEPQQGHISQKVEMADHTNVDVNLRVETVQTVNGMDIVMRLFNMYQSMYNLDRLGLSDSERAVVNDIIAKPTGLVMVVGPTGSGKTTTLYSMLNQLNNDQRKIITVEDPVEYQFEGVTQMSIDSKGEHNDSNFIDRLKAVLRIDPDVIMIGEIRDEDTAKTALQAALTGHLVLATFHAGSAAAALTRLGSVIEENSLFTSAIRLIMAQRLVRKLDDTYKESYQPDQAERDMLMRLLEKMPNNILKPDINDSTMLFRPIVNDQNPFGYNGQIAIREQYLMTEEIKQVISKSHDSRIISTDLINEAADRSGLNNMYGDGMAKVLAGMTTISEIARVLDF